ncbi:MAG: hypothetical protein ACPLSA_06295 [Caldanaerobacter sp.]
MKNNETKSTFFTELNYEIKLNEIAEKLNIPFKVQIVKDTNKTKDGPLGEVDMATKTIRILRYQSWEDLLFTFFHEVVEILLAPSYKSLLTVLNAQNDLLSKLLESQKELDIINAYQQRYVSEQFYAEKEKAIDEIASLLVKLYGGDGR